MHVHVHWLRHACSQCHATASLTPTHASCICALAHIPKHSTSPTSVTRMQSAHAHMTAYPISHTSRSIPHHPSRGTHVHAYDVLATEQLHVGVPHTSTCTRMLVALIRMSRIHAPPVVSRSPCAKHIATRARAHAHVLARACMPSRDGCIASRDRRVHMCGA